MIDPDRSWRRGATRKRLRCARPAALLWILAALIGVAVAPTTTSSASTVVYDVPAVACVDVRSSGGADSGSAQLTVVRERSALPSTQARGASTTRPSRSVATNKVDDVIGAACSFSAETRVLMADGTTKPISEIEVGDEVLAYDPESGERGSREVTHLWVHQDALVDLEIGGAVLATTEDHPFWNETDKRWERADALDAGDLVLTADGDRVQVGKLAIESRFRTAYNLTVDDIHAYYVQAGDEKVLVHNNNTCSPALWEPTTGGASRTATQTPARCRGTPTKNLN
jgi:Pretoxin HINT domain